MPLSDITLPWLCSYWKGQSSLEDLMKVSVQTDAQAWKAQADAGQAATLLHDQFALPALSMPHHVTQQRQQGLLRLVIHLSGSSKPSPARLWVQMSPHASFLLMLVVCSCRHQAGGPGRHPVRSDAGLPVLPGPGAQAIPASVRLRQVLCHGSWWVTGPSMEFRPCWML